MKKIEFYRHNIEEQDIQNVVNVLRSTFLSTGPIAKQFEEDFAKYMQAGDAIGLNSCTAGLFLALKAMDIGPGDEVITSPLTFIATANAIMQVGAKPVFVDVEAQTGNIDANLIEQAITPNTKAIMPIHLYGQMCDMKAIRALADKHNLKIIEDCAHCIEGERDGIRPGQLSDAAAYSFYATKNLACGEGGALTVHDPELSDRVRVLRLHGMSKSAVDRYHGIYKHWDMIELGYKMNLSDIQAALLESQLGRLKGYLEQRHQLAKFYEDEFSKIDGIDFPKVLPNSVSARHLFTIWVDPQFRDQMLTDLGEKQVGVAVNFRAIHLLSYYKNLFQFSRNDFPIAEKIGDSTITIPFYPKLTMEEAQEVVNRVKEVVASYSKAA